MVKTLYMLESMGEITMVTNAELAKEVTEKREDNRLVEEALEAIKTKLDEIVETIDKVKEKLGDVEDKEKAIDEKDMIP